jgi:hypothetical protein
MDQTGYDPAPAFALAFVGVLMTYASAASSPPLLPVPKTPMTREVNPEHAPAIVSKELA